MNSNNSFSDSNINSLLKELFKEFLNKTSKHAKLGSKNDSYIITSRDSINKTFDNEEKIVKYLHKEISKCVTVY